MFNNKTILITGGTGSFGKRFISILIKKYKPKKLIVFSRDEYKQFLLQKKFPHSKFPFMRFFLGDVRDLNRLNLAFKDVDYVFHAAALKQVPSCEFFPLEATKTNVFGTQNVIDAAENNKVSKVICLSTDKAAYPINAMGMSKALMEKVMIAKSRILEDNKSIFCGTRYGNVMGSRGSVIPLFISQIKNNKDLTITDPTMTRFMMSLDDAVNLVDYAFEHANQGDLFIKKAPSSTIATLADALIEIFNSNSKIREIGIRHGEKMHETLVTKEEMLKSEDLGDHFRIQADSRDLNYDKYFFEGDSNNKEQLDYNSGNTEILSKDKLIEILLKLPLVNSQLK